MKNKQDPRFDDRLGHCEPTIEAYKIFSVGSSGELLSYTSPKYTYCRSKINKPWKGWGPFACFDDWQEMLRFFMLDSHIINGCVSDMIGRHEFWKVEIERAPNGSFLHDAQGANGIGLYFRLPPGTVLASSIRLVERLFIIEP